MQISNKGIDLIKTFEGCKLSAYQDVAGVWTIGYGWTQPIDGVSIKCGMVISMATAERLLRIGLVQYESAVNQLVKVPVSQHQFDALVSFAYNLGIRSLSTSTLLRKLNAGDSVGAAGEFLKWNRAGGEIVAGLARRRAIEKQIFLS